MRKRYALGLLAVTGNSASAGPGGSWTSEAIPIEAGRTYDLSVDVVGSGGAVVQQLSALGGVLASAPLGSTLTPLAGVTQVRIVLNGGLVGATTFDNVWMGEI
jgi:hypothetical protein